MNIHVPTRTLKHRLTSASFGLFALVFLLAAKAQAQCPSYPIALSAKTLANVQVGAVVNDIFNGSQPGNFGWLTWTGDPGEPTLVDSLIQPGDSYTYVNPLNANDHQLVVGDWVSGKPGVSNGKHVRTALDKLIGVNITVPIWDQAVGEGANTTYHISGFAIIQILSYQLPNQNRITAKFLGYSDCGGIGPS